MTGVILFVLGTIVGSFLNVVGLRWGKQTFGGRSACPSCHHKLRWYELVPLVSFIIQLGRCRECRAKISWQYPLIELWTGLVFVTIFSVASLSFYYLVLIMVFSLYIVIFIYDWYHKIIPDELVYLSIFFSLLIPLFFIHYSLLDWLAGPIIFLFFASIWFFSRGRAMGFGDAKLGLSVGLLLGAAQGFSAIVLAFWIGALGSLLFIFINKAGFIKDDKKLTIKSEVPFAPAIIVATWLSLVFNLNILNVVLF